MRGVLRGIFAVCMGVLLFAPPVSAAETVITAQVAPVRHIVVDGNGTIQKIVSNTSEDVDPIVHLNSFEGEELPLSPEVEERYRLAIAHLDMEGPTSYVRKPPLKLLLANLRLPSLLLSKIL